MDTLSGEDRHCGHIECPSGYICGKMISNPNGNIINFDNILYSLL